MWGQMRAVIWISLLNILLAIGKDGLLAAYLGTTGSSDAFFLAFFIPDMIGNNLVAAALGVASVPYLANWIQSESKVGMKRVYAMLLEEGLILGVFVAVFMAAAASLFVEWVGKGFSPHETKLALNLLYLMIPTVLIYPLVTLSINFLQVMGHYRRSMVALWIPNGLILVVAIFLSAIDLPRALGVMGLGAAVVLGILCQGIYLFLVTWMCMDQEAKENFLDEDTRQSDTLIASGSSLDRERKQRFKVFAGYGLLLLLSQWILFFERYLGGVIAEGGVSAITYSYRLSQFPVLLFGYSISIIAFPELSKALSQERLSEPCHIYRRALRSIVTFSIPIAIGLSILREPLITILYKRFAFDQLSVQMSAEVLAGYGLAVIGQGLILLNIRILTAFRDLKVPLILMLTVTLIQMVFDWEAVQLIGLGGIGWGALLGAVLGGLCLTGLIFHRLKMNVLEEVIFLVKIIYANAFALLIAGFALWLWKNYFVSAGFLTQLTYGVVSGSCICAASYISIKKLKLI